MSEGAAKTNNTPETASVAAAASHKHIYMAFIINAVHCNSHRIFQNSCFLNDKLF